MEKIPLIVIVGPTAVGKTATAISLAKKIKGEVVSADSMQVYRYMNIGTAKPTADEMQGVVHHLIDIVDPLEEFNVVKYTRLAHEAIKDIASRGKIPVLVGGTGLYIDSVVKNIKYAETTTQQDYRNELLLIANEKGNEYVYNMLLEADPKTADRLHPNDLRRVIRALEVHKFTGVPMSDMVSQSVDTPKPYNTIFFGLSMEREILYDRINKRVDIMLENGLVDEVKQILDMGVKPENTSMNGIGYKEIAQYLTGEVSLDEAVEAIKQGSRNYAKRQMTWFKRNNDINWTLVTPYSDIESIASSYARYLKDFHIL